MASLHLSLPLVVNPRSVISKGVALESLKLKAFSPQFLLLKPPKSRNLNPPRISINGDDKSSFEPIKPTSRGRKKGPYFILFDNRMHPDNSLLLSLGRHYRSTLSLPHLFLCRGISLTSAQLSYLPQPGFLHFDSSPDRFHSDLPHLFHHKEMSKFLDMLKANETATCPCCLLNCEMAK